MRVERRETFLGLENDFPEEMRSAIQELVRRIETELDGLIDSLRNSWTVSRDVEAILFDIDGSRIFEELQDGTKLLLEEDFGEDTATL